MCARELCPCTGIWIVPAAKAASRWARSVYQPSRVLSAGHLPLLAKPAKPLCLNHYR